MRSISFLHPAFIHVNIVARDWRGLAEFYKGVFGCTEVPPMRDLSGRWLEDATGIRGAEVRGVHLRLPGRGEGGPTLEIFQYNIQGDRLETAANRPGLAHIAFAVDDARAALDAVIAAGRGAVGDLVSAEVPGVGRFALVYAADPEGNIIELQQRPRP